MVLNYAENIYLGQETVQDVYCGDIHVWTMGEPTSPVTKFEIDTTRYDAADGNIYDINGNIFGYTGVTSGENTNAPNSYGLHFNDNTYARTNDNEVYLPTDYPWTITYRVKDIWEGKYEGTSFVMGLYNGNDKKFNMVINTDYISFVIGNQSNVQNVATTYGTCYYGNSSIGYISTLARPKEEMCAWHNELKMICDTEKIHFYLNGIKQMDFPVSEFGDKIDNILFGHNVSPTPFTMTYFKISAIAESIDTIVYKWHITKKDRDSYFSVAKLYMYTEEENGVYSGDVGVRPQNFVCGYVNSNMPTRPDIRSLPTELIGIGTYGSGVYNRTYGNGVYNANASAYVDIYMACPLWNQYGKDDLYKGDTKIIAYQYLSPDESFDYRMPVSWTMEVSLNGGATWATLDTQSEQYNRAQNSLSPVYTVTWPD